MSEQTKLKKFFSFKYNFYKEEFTAKENILMVDRQRVDSTIINSLITLAVNKKYKINVIILSDLKPENPIIKIYQHIGFKKYLNGVDKLQFLKHPYLFISAIVFSMFGLINIFNKNFIWFVKNYKINNIPFGDLIYDTNIRFNHRYMDPKIDYRFIKLLITSTFRILLLLKYFKDYNIKKVIVGTENYSFNPGIALRIASFKKMKSYYPGRTNETEFEIATDDKKKLFLGRDNIRNPSIKKKYKNFKPKLQEINQFYLSRKKETNTKFFWTMDSYKVANAQSELGLDFIKKISKIKSKKILYASHAFSDAAHQKGLIYSFQDFYDQFISTLSFVFNNDNENIWIFRSHPSSKIWNEQKYFNKVIYKYKKKNIYICPENVPISKLYDICDVVVTGSGTAGLEFICEGKQAVLAGCSAYNNKILTPYCAKNKRQYFKYLKNISSLKKTDKIQIDMGKKILYFFESVKFIPKKISDLINKDKIFNDFFLNFFGLGLNLKNYYSLIHNMLKKDIHKSKVFNKMIKLV